MWVLPKHLLTTDLAPADVMIAKILQRDGEKIVGRSLEELRAGGAIDLHDIVAKDFNVDHLVISYQGIFVIETKTFSKLKGRDARVVFDGEKLLVDGWPPRKDPIKQVQADR